MAAISPDNKPKRVLTVAPMPPEKCAYALARYSRSPDSIRQSLDWVRTHDSQKFLESFYFQYGHASIADLGHAVICFEGISEIAATEIEDQHRKAGLRLLGAFTADQAQCDPSIDRALALENR